jgi:hypothetical protein
MHVGVEVGVEALPGPWDLSNQGAAPSGEVYWLVKSPEAWNWLCGYWALDEFRAVSEQNRVNRQSKPSMHRYDANGHVRKM